MKKIGIGPGFYIGGGGPVLKHLWLSLEENKIDLCPLYVLKITRFLSAK